MDLTALSKVLSDCYVHRGVTLFLFLGENTDVKSEPASPDEDSSRAQFGKQCVHCRSHPRILVAPVRHRQCFRLRLFWSPLVWHPYVQIMCQAVGN